MRYSGKVDKVYGGELIVKDVCAPCNNVTLSALDDYASKLYDPYFKTIINADDQVTFRYDYNLLYRWLLKLSFNSARLNGADEKFFVPLIPYMLGTAEKPDIVSIMLDVVLPSVVNGRKLEPKSARAARVTLVGAGPWICLRFVSIHSYYFYIVITDPNLTSTLDEMLEVHQTLKGQLLRPNGESALANHTSTFAEDHLPHFLAKRKQYDEFVAKYRKLH